jgi:hypothetical protein
MTMTTMDRLPTPLDLDSAKSCLLHQQVALQLQGRVKGLMDTTGSIRGSYYSGRVQL